MAQHPSAPSSIYGFITPPGQTDILMVVATWLVVGAVLLVGVLFLWLHALPERRAHKQDKYQFELIAVLCLLSLFSGLHIFWVAGLLLAFIQFPDVKIPDGESPLSRIAEALEAQNDHTSAPTRPQTRLESPKNVEAGE